MAVRREVRSTNWHPCTVLYCTRWWYEWLLVTWHDEVVDSLVLFTYSPSLSLSFSKIQWGKKRRNEKKFQLQYQTYNSNHGGGAEQYNSLNSPVWLRKLFTSSCTSLTPLHGMATPLPAVNPNLSVIPNAASTATTHLLCSSRWHVWSSSPTSSEWICYPWIVNPTSAFVSGTGTCITSLLRSLIYFFFLDFIGLTRLELNWNQFDLIQFAIYP